MIPDPTTSGMLRPDGDDVVHATHAGDTSHHCIRRMARAERAKIAVIERFHVLPDGLSFCFPVIPGQDFSGSHR